MEHRRGQIHKGDGSILPVTISGDGGDHDVVEHLQQIELSFGPSSDSDIIYLDPNEVQITPIGEPAGGYQKVEVDTEKGPLTLFMATT